MLKQGKVYKFGDNIDTDVIIPARYLNTQDEKELASYCMIDIDTAFAGNVREGDIIVAGSNFGCGSSREHAPISIKASGVSVIIAKSFARIFYRNAINIGLAIMESEEASKKIMEGDEINVDLTSGKIVNITRGEEYFAEPFPEFVQNIINCNGYINSIKKVKSWKK